MQIDGYEDLVEIGRGASAIVYRARQAAFGRTVALKVLSSWGADGELHRRFERERRAIGSLGWHPRVVPVYEAGVTADGHPYLTMEYLPAGSFAHRLARSGPLSAKESVAIGVQVADALDAAHRVGVLHRDVKPGNVLVGHFGDAKLGDFGIAAMSSGATSVTDAFIGTMAFMAPELVNGGKATPSSDVYSLGSTLFTLMTARLAYSSPTDETLLAAVMRIAHDDVPSLVAHGVDASVASVVERSMAKDPSARIPTAADLVAELMSVSEELGWPRIETYAHRSPATGATTPAVTSPMGGTVDGALTSPQAEQLETTARRLPTVPGAPGAGPVPPTILRPPPVAGATKPLPDGPAAPVVGRSSLRPAAFVTLPDGLRASPTSMPAFEAPEDPYRGYSRFQEPSRVAHGDAPISGSAAARSSAASRVAGGLTAAVGAIVMGCLLPLKHAYGLPAPEATLIAATFIATIVCGVGVLVGRAVRPALVAAILLYPGASSSGLVLLAYVDARTVSGVALPFGLASACAAPLLAWLASGMADRRALHAMARLPLRCLSSVAIAAGAFLASLGMMIYRVPGPAGSSTQWGRAFLWDPSPSGAAAIPMWATVLIPALWLAAFAIVFVAPRGNRRGLFLTASTIVVMELARRRWEASSGHTSLMVGSSVALLVSAAGFAAAGVLGRSSPDGSF